MRPISAVLMALALLAVAVPVVRGLRRGPRIPNFRAAPAALNVFVEHHLAQRSRHVVAVLGAQLRKIDEALDAERLERGADGAARALREGRIVVRKATMRTCGVSLRSMTACRNSNMRDSSKRTLQAMVSNGPRLSSASASFTDAPG